MEKKKTLRKLLPYIVAIVGFAAISMFYFAPQFNGKALSMTDIVQYEGAAREIKDHIVEYGEDPQWAGNSFSGMPSVLINMQHDTQIIRKSFPLIEFMGRPASMIFLAMAAFFVMLLLFRMNPWVAIVPALAYGLSTYFFIIIDAGHITKMLALAYAPLMVGGVFYTIRRNIWLGSALMALFASLQIASNHPQITYYFGFIILALWINELIRAIKKHIIPRFAKATGMLIVAVILALGSNLSPLWYTNEYSKSSIRGGSELTQPATGVPAEGANRQTNGLDIEYATQWSYGIGETFNIYVPYLFGGSSAGNFSDDGPVASSLTKYGARNIAVSLPSYWGDQPGTAGPTYLGAVAIFLAVLGMFLIRSRKIMWVVAVSILAIMLSWGHNFMWLTELFFYYFPGYNKFRAVAMILVIVEWSVPFLAALALNKLWRGAGDNSGMLGVGGEIADSPKSPNHDDTGEHGGKGLLTKERLFRAAKYSTIIVGGIALLFILCGGMLFDFIAPSDSVMGLPDDVLAAMREERADMMRSDSWRSLIFVLLAASVVLLYGSRKIKRGVMVGLLAVLVCADLVAVNLRFLPQDKFMDKGKTEIVATEADIQILADPEPGFRVVNLSVNPFSDAKTSYFHRSIGGYHGAKMQRYQEVIERYLSSMDWEVYSMLNTKYIIDANEQTGELTVQESPLRNGPAWFVESVRTVDSPDEEFAALEGLDSKNEAVVDRRFASQLAGINPSRDSADYITLADYKSNHLTYVYRTASENVAVFSEIYYDNGWQAYLDGQPVPHFRADYILRGMVLPAGEHTVEFKFRAKNFELISGLALVFSLLIVFGVIAAAVVTYLCNRNKKNEDAKRQETAA